jgi:hypothetical protein
LFVIVVCRCARLLVAAHGFRPKAESVGSKKELAAYRSSHVECEAHLQGSVSMRWDRLH